jgi:proteic killer suppression protein
MIKSFSDKSTKELFARVRVRQLPAHVHITAYKKLLLIDAASNLNDLRIPPGNKLEKLTGKMTDTYSIRINDQWRIIFKWIENNAFDVQIIDYHKG